MTGTPMCAMVLLANITMVGECVNIHVFFKLAPTPQHKRHREPLVYLQ